MVDLEQLKKEGWITDQEALDVVIALKGIQPGDEIYVAELNHVACNVPEGVYEFGKYLDNDLRHPLRLADGLKLYRDHFAAWRPKRDQHS